MAGSMPDWPLDALEAFLVFMTEGSTTDLVVMLALGLLGAYGVVVVHELGHAVAALAVGERVREVRIGNEDRLTITAGRFRLRLGLLREHSDVGGHVVHSGSSATPRHVLVIALAGPAANLLAAAALAVPTARADGFVVVPLALWTLVNVAVAVDNLRPTGDPQDPNSWSDGRWAQAAWALRRHLQAATTSDGATTPNRSAGSSTGPSTSRATSSS